MYFIAPMRERLQALLVSAPPDLVLGSVLLFWPGVWQELVHPDAIGTVFYPFQQVGVGLLVRVALAVLAWRRGGPWLTALAAAWFIEVPGELFAIWRVGDAGPWADWVHAGRALLTAGIGLWLWRLRPAETLS